GTLVVGDSAHLNLHCGFMGIAGDGEVSVRVYETGNPSNADTITFIYHAVSTAGIFDNSVNKALSLSQNFPNPFTTSTTINYQLEQSYGKLIITDIQGKNIAEYLLNDSSGKLVITEKFVPGVYFYSLYENNKLISKNKMIVQ
ncbi:MAG TPA: T9SS type A sorting domain-containing protein, partial [Bacteroidia bacterium]|nr:T9SS type A sorting domain-containing protein [Bacteroidia bacterium]